MMVSMPRMLRFNGVLHFCFSLLLFSLASLLAVMSKPCIYLRRQGQSQAAQQDDLELKRRMAKAGSTWWRSGKP